MSSLLTRKLKTFFKVMDLNNDGSISLKDYVDMGQRHCDAENANAVEREKTIACFTKVWRSWMKSAESDDNGLLTPSIMVESMKQQRNDPKFKETFRALCHQFFRIIDVNGDGFLQEDEYARSVFNIGVEDAGIVRRIFESIDLNRDGKLSFDEFATAMIEYLTSEDEKSPYTGLMGPLVD